MEPWDGPASIAFTDGTVIGAVLDRNGLRPSPLLGHRRRPRDHGVARSACSTSTRRRSCRRAGSQPGRMFLVDTDRRAASSATTRSRPSSPPQQPYERVARTPASSTSTTCPPRDVAHAAARVAWCSSSGCSATRRRSCKILIAPMARTGAEPIGSMGTDTPVAVLSDRPRLLFDYFQQLFAQVTNPPLDAIREELVTALGSTIGPEGNLLDPGPASCRQIVLPRPDPRQRGAGQAPLHRRRRRRRRASSRSPSTACTRSPTAATACARAIERIRAPGERRDRRRRQAHHPLRPLLDRRATRRSRRCSLTAAVHHHLIREKTRTQVGLVVETGEAREVHHMALLLGYGAGGDQPVPRLRDDRAT